MLHFGDAHLVASSWLHVVVCLLSKAFGPDTWPTWALVTVGIWAARIALRTLTAIHHEAKIGSEIAAAARDNAAASNANALVLIIENRSWLVIEEIKTPNLTPPEGYFPSCVTLTKNYGKTPARVLTVGARLYIGDNPLRPPVDLNVVIEATSPAPEPYVFPPGAMKAATASLFGISPEQRSEILESRVKFLWLLGFVKYTDTFRREPVEEHETRFCYFYETRNQEPTWIQAGPPDHNRAT